MQSIWSVRAGNFILDSVLESLVVLILEGVVVPVRLARVLLEFRCVGRRRPLLLKVLQSTYRCAFLVDVAVDRVDSLLESFLREKEVDSSLFGSGRDSSLGVPILDVICDEGLGPCECRSFEESNSPEDLLRFRIELDRIKT